MVSIRTAYSFGFGLLRAEEIMDRARGNYTHLALTDLGHTAALLPLMERAQKSGIQIVPGVEIRNGHKLLYSVLALNNDALTSSSGGRGYFVLGLGVEVTGIVAFVQLL